MQVRALVLDQQRHVVADLGYYTSFGPVSSLTLDRIRFVPEQDRIMYGTDNNGGTLSWNGAGSGNSSLPNGYYRIQVQSPGGPQVEAQVYLEHQAWQAGSVAVSLLKGDTQARIRWNYSEYVLLRFDLYNLAGELVWQARAEGPAGEVDWALSSASGAPTAGGIYILKSLASSVDGAVDDLRIIKLAVVR